MKRESRIVDRSHQVDSPKQRHLPLVDLLVDTRAELMELLMIWNMAGAGLETRDLVFIDAGPAPHVLHIGSPLLRRQSPLLRGPARLRGPALPGLDGGLLNQGDETCPSGLAVLRLRAVLPAVEYKHAMGGHAATGKHCQAGFDV